MKRLLAISLTLLMAAGCALNPFARDPVERAKDMTPTGTAFNQALYRAYLTRAEEKVQIGARDSAKYFADKARLAADGSAIIPEDLAVDRVGQAAFTDLDAARTSLVRSLVDGGRDQAPEESAQSQSYFDCWVNASESKDTAETARCKAAFEGALKNLQVALNAAPAGTQASTGPAPTAQNRNYKVYFGLDEWHLSAEALSTITDSINTARSEGQSQIISAGHADRSGAAPYNLKLSEHRAAVVKDVMVEMGAREDAIKIESYGETKPAVQTADGVKEPKNRRVEITLVP